MKISEDRLLDLAGREIRMYDSTFGYHGEIEKVWFERDGSDDRKMAIYVLYKDGIQITLCGGKDLDEMAKSYLDDLKTVWETDSFEEFELLLDSRGF